MINKLIPKRGLKCLRCGNPFADRCVYHSMVVENVAAKALDRRDYCDPCAKELLKNPSSDTILSLWKSTHPPAKEAHQKPLHLFAFALALLEEQIAKNDSSLFAEMFVLSLYLLRKKILYQRQEVKLSSGVDGLIFEVAETGKLICVPKVELSSLQIENLQKSIAYKLK